MRLSGVLFFPVTPFDAGGEINTSALHEHVSAGLEHGPGGVFVACGTGEFSALAPAEYAVAVKTAAAATGGSAPVLAGTGGSLPLAREFAARAADSGADGLLLLPPYLSSGPPQGTLRYVEAVTAATELPVIVYQRGSAVFTAETAVGAARLPNVVGFKDGLGDLERMHAIVRAVRRQVAPDFPFFNGLPTAELTVPAYRGIGVPLYSSAVFCFAPEVATAFHAAVEGGDQERVDLLVDEFFAPLVALRNTTPGYPVSLVKAGVRLRGLDVGSVRPPLVDPRPEHLEELRRLIDHGLDLVGAR